MLSAVMKQKLRNTSSDESVQSLVTIPYRIVGSAIDGDPREPTGRGLIIAIGSAEYLVPEERRHEAGDLVEVTFRLDQAQNIINRTGTRQIKEMTLSADVPPEVHSILGRAVEGDNLPDFGYKVHFIRPHV